MRLTGDLHKIFSIFFLNLSFFESLQLGNKWFSNLMRIPRGIFGTVKLKKFQHWCPFAYLKNLLL